MYCPAQFEENRPDVLLQFIACHPLATIISHGSTGLVADHVPLMHVMEPGTSGKLIGHVAKNNALWQATPEQQHLLIFQGPSEYISPNWYATKFETGKVVPTWNYVAVHVHARLAAIHEPAQILAILDRLTMKHEASQAKPWHVSDAPADFLENLVNHVVGVEFTINSMQGKWKVSQNQPPRNQQTVISGLRDRNGDAAGEMAALVEKFGAGDS